MSKFSLLLLSLSVFCFVSAGFYAWQIVSPSKAFEQIALSTPIGPFVPASLSISSIDLNLGVIVKTLENNRWPTSANSLIFVSTSSLPGSNGNSIFYGHNWKSLLGSLSQVKAGDDLKITLSNGQILVYKIESRQEVAPQDDELLKPTSDSRLTLYTCSGFLDSKRLVVVAKPVSN